MPGSDDEGPFFDFDFTVPLYASSEGNATESGSESDDSAGLTDRDFTIHLDRSPLASPACSSYESLFFGRGLVGVDVDPPKFCASEARHSYSRPSAKHRQQLRVLSFGSKKFALFYTRDSACSRSSSSSSRSARLFFSESFKSSPAKEEKKLNSDIVSRYWSKISNKFGRVGTRDVAIDQESKPARSGSMAFRLGSGRLKKSLSASDAVHSQSKMDDSLLEKDSGIESAIAHCKQSFQRGAGSESDMILFRSRSDPGQCDDH